MLLRKRTILAIAFAGAFTGVSAMAGYGMTRAADPASALTMKPLQGVSPTSPTEGVGRRQAAEILRTQLQRSALQGMSAHSTSRLFRAVIFGGG